jgi:superfamily II DNA or RNA helicase
MNEIYDIIDMLDNGVSILDILDKYKSTEIKFIQKKNKLYFSNLFETVEELIDDGLTKEQISLELDVLKDLDIDIKNKIISKIVKKENIVIDTDTDNTIIVDDSTDPYDTDVDIPELNIDGFDKAFLRKNQLDAIQKMKEQKFISGINCQIMGAGKSYIILNTIYEHYLIKKKKEIYVILTERIEILKQWFLKDGKFDLDKFNFWKQKNVINMDLFNIVERFDTKKPIKFDFTDKPTIFICNNAFMRTHYRYKKEIDVKKISLVLVDECHSINDKNYEMLKHFKQNNIHIIGFSATPIRTETKSKIYIVDIYSNGDNKINLISNYTLIDALNDNIVLPFKHHIINVKKLDKRLIREFYKNHIETNDELPYKKGIGWTKNIKDINNNNKDNLYDIINRTFKSSNVLTTYSGNINCGIDKFYKDENNSVLLCVNKCKEGSDIQNTDYGMFLDFVKSRNINVFLQMAGRIMRPDKENKKKYAVLFEFVKTDSEIEYNLVNKIVGYYEMILNMSCYDVRDNDKLKLLEQMKNIYDNTMIDTFKNKIIVKQSLSGTICEIDFDENVIDWSKFTNLFKSTMKTTYNIDTVDKLSTEYNELKYKIKHLNLLSDTETKIDYIKYAIKYNLEQNPEIKYYEYGWTNYYDFTNYDISRFPSNKEEVKIICKKNKIGLNNYRDLAKIYNLPVMFEELYGCKLNTILKKNVIQ